MKLIGTVSGLLIFALIGILSGTSVAQCSFIDKKSPEAVAREVNRIFNASLDRMEYRLPSGIKATTWMPPDKNAHEQIKCLGESAVPAIAHLVRGNNRSFGRLLAIQMLGWIGGPDIVPPLQEVLAASGDSTTNKIWALESLTDAPPAQAIPVIKRVLNSEKDPEVREKAGRVLVRLEDSLKN